MRATKDVLEKADAFVAAINESGGKAWRNGTSVFFGTSGGPLMGFCLEDVPILAAEKAPPVVTAEEIVEELERQWPEALGTPALWREVRAGHIAALVEKRLQERERRVATLVAVAQQIASAEADMSTPNQRNVWRARLDDAIRALMDSDGEASGAVQESTHSSAGVAPHIALTPYSEAYAPGTPEPEAPRGKWNEVWRFYVEHVAPDWWVMMGDGEDGQGLARCPTQADAEAVAAMLRAVGARLR